MCHGHLHRTASISGCGQATNTGQGVVEEDSLQSLAALVTFVFLELPALPVTAPAPYRDLQDDCTSPIRFVNCTQ